MWFGLLYDNENDTAKVVAYKRDRIFTATGATEMAPTTIALLREASDGGRTFVPPRCRACQAPLEVPPVEP